MLCSKSDEENIRRHASDMASDPNVISMTAPPYPADVYNHRVDSITEVSRLFAANNALNRTDSMPFSPIPTEDLIGGLHPEYAQPPSLHKEASDFRPIDH